VDAGVAFTAAIGDVRVDFDGGEWPIRRRRAAGVRQAGTVTALALHVLIARVLGRPVADGGVNDGVAEVVDGMALLAGARRVSARLQRIPGAVVFCPRPARLRVDVTRATDGLLVRRVEVAEEAPRNCVRGGEICPVSEDDTLARATGRESPHADGERADHGCRVNPDQRRQPSETASQTRRHVGSPRRGGQTVLRVSKPQQRTFGRRRFPDRAIADRAERPWREGASIAALSGFP